MKKVILSLIISLMAVACLAQRVETEPYIFKNSITAQGALYGITSSEQSEQIYAYTYPYTDTTNITQVYSGTSLVARTATASTEWPDIVEGINVTGQGPATAFICDTTLYGKYNTPVKLKLTYKRSGVGGLVITGIYPELGVWDGSSFTSICYGETNAVSATMASKVWNLMLNYTNYSNLAKMSVVWHVIATGSGSQTLNLQLGYGPSISGDVPTYMAYMPTDTWIHGFRTDNPHLVYADQVGALSKTNNSYVIAIPSDDLLAKYAQATNLTPNGSALSTSNRAYLCIIPGTYTLSSDLNVNTEFVDIIGLGTQRKKPSVSLINNTINVSADDVRIVGISVGEQAFTIGSNKTLNVFDSCYGGGNSFGGQYGGHAAGTFVDCVGGNVSFGSRGICSGTFIDCVGGNGSFSGDSLGNPPYGYLSGTLVNCTAGQLSFGSYGTISASARLYNCRITAAGHYFADSGSIEAGAVLQNCIDGYGVRNIGVGFNELSIGTTSVGGVVWKTNTVVASITTNESGAVTAINTTNIIYLGR